MRKAKRDVGGPRGRLALEQSFLAAAVEFAKSIAYFCAHVICLSEAHLYVHIYIRRDYVN